MKSLTWMDLLILNSLILLHNNVCIYNRTKNAQRMRLSYVGFCILSSIIAGESSFSTGDNHGSTVIASAIAPVSALDFGVKFMTHPVLRLHFPRMSEINCARVCPWKRTVGFRRRELRGERARRRRRVRDYKRLRRMK